MHNRLCRPGSKAGWTLLETIIALSFALIISSLAMTGYKKVQNKREVALQLDNVRQLVSNLNRWKIQRGTLDGLTTKTALDNGLIPARLLRGNRPATAWGSFNVHECGKDSQNVVIGFAGVPVEQCVQLVTALVPVSSWIFVEGLVLHPHMGKVDMDRVLHRCQQKTKKNESAQIDALISFGEAGPMGQCQGGGHFHDPESGTSGNNGGGNNGGNNGGNGGGKTP